MSSGGAVIYRKVRQESKNICSLVQVNFVYNGHFILNSFSLTTQQTHIYRLGDTIRTRASDVTWEVGRIYYLVKRVPLQQLWEWSIYVVVMNVIFIRWWGEGRGGEGRERCYDCGQQTLDCGLNIYLDGIRHEAGGREPLHWPGDQVTTLPALQECHHAEHWGCQTQSPARRPCWPMRWPDGQSDAQ